MDEQKEAEVRMMLKREGKTHEEINSIVKQWKISEEKEALDAQIQEAISEPESEAISEEEPEEKKVSILSINEGLVIDALREGMSKSSDEITARKLEILGKIEEVIKSKEETLSKLIVDAEKKNSELEKLYQDAQKQLSEDRLSEREIYRKTLSTFHDSIASILNNFADSTTEKSLILLFNREGSVIGLKSVQSTKSVLSKDDLKIGA
jgi:hypothetical protein